MKKKLYLLFSVLVVLFQFSIAQAQERLWGVNHGSIFSVRTDGSDYKTLSNPGGGIGDEVLGIASSPKGIIYVTHDTDDNTNEGNIGILNGQGADDIYDLCYTCPFGAEGMVTGVDGKVYIPFRGGPKMFGVRIVNLETHVVETVPFPSNNFLSDDFYLTATANGIYGISRVSTHGLVYRIKSDGTDIVPIHSFSGGATGSRPTGKLIAGTDGSLFGETLRGGKDNKGIYFKVNSDGSGFVNLGDIADGKRTDLVNGKYQILLNHIAAGYKPIRDSEGFIYHSTPLGIFKVNTAGVPVLKIAEHSGFLVDLFAANAPSAVKVNNISSGATNVPANTPFELATVPGASGYELQLSTSPDFKTDVKTFDIAYLPLTGVKLKSSTTYYVRARAWSWPYYGETVHFTTETLIDFSQERIWGYFDDGNVPLGSNIFSMKKDGSDVIVHQQTAGGFIKLSDHRVLTTTLSGDGDFMNRIDRDGVNYLHAMDYQQGYTVGTSMIEISPGRLVGTQFGAGNKVRGLVEFDVEGTLYEHRTFSSTKDLSHDQYLTHTSHGIYGVSRGDSNNKGFIYRVDDDMNGYTIVYQFQGLADGKQPAGRIYAGEGDFIFGQTLRGGLSNKGIFFKVRDDGTSFTKIGDVHNGQPWIADGGGRYSNLEKLIDARYPGVLQDGEGNYYLGTTNGILKIGADYYLKKHIAGIPNAENLTIVAPSFVPETFVSNIEDGSYGLPNNLTLHTDSFPGASQYFFELSTSSDFSTIDFAVSNSKPYANVQGLQSGRTYYSRVRPNVWPYFGQVVSFSTNDGITSENERLIIRTVEAPYFGLGSDGIVYTDKNGSHGVTLGSGRYGTEGRHILPLSNGELLYKQEEVLVKITRGGIVKLYDLDWADHRWMQESWVQGADGDVYALRYSVDNKQFKGVVKVKLDGSGLEFHPILMNQFNGYSPKLVSTPYGIYAINQGTGGSPGVIFKIRADLNGLDIIHTFSGTSKPQGELLLHHDGYFWGVTRNGGNFGGGVIYRIKPDGTEYEVLHHFAPNSGKSPVVGLLDGINGWVYGVAREGGKDNKGVLFRIHEDFYTYEVVRHFADVGGKNPDQPLVMDSDWHIYGSAQGLGYFKTNLDGTFFTTILNAPLVDRIQVLPQRFVPDVQVIVPADQSEIPADSTTFTVTDVFGAVTYFVEVSESPVFNGHVNTFQGTGSDVKVSGLEPYTTYYSRVRTNLLPFYGETTSFTTGNPPSLPSVEAADTDARIAGKAAVYAYPNPSQAAFTLSHELNVRSLVITDANGFVVFEQDNISHDTAFEFGADLKKGIYILKAVTDEGVTTSRLIKH